MKNHQSASRIFHKYTQFSRLDSKREEKSLFPFLIINNSKEILLENFFFKFEQSSDGSCYLIV